MMNMNTIQFTSDESRYELYIYIKKNKKHERVNFFPRVIYFAGVEGAAGPGLPADFKGTYELFAVVTHKGREADGGER